MRFTIGGRVVTRNIPHCTIGITRCMHKNQNSFATNRIKDTGRALEISIAAAVPSILIDATIDKVGLHPLSGSFSANLEKRLRHGIVGKA